MDVVAGRQSATLPACMHSENQGSPLVGSPRVGMRTSQRASGPVGLPYAAWCVCQSLPRACHAGGGSSAPLGSNRHGSNTPTSITQSLHRRTLLASRGGPRRGPSGTLQAPPDWRRRGRCDRSDGRVTLAGFGRIPGDGDNPRLAPGGLVCTRFANGESFQGFQTPLDP